MMFASAAATSGEIRGEATAERRRNQPEAENAEQQTGDHANQAPG
jgi:hypothetical protein